MESHCSIGYIFGFKWLKKKKDERKESYENEITDAPTDRMSIKGTEGEVRS